jgi:nucleoside-diphosphate-sugar epimerase
VFGDGTQTRSFCYVDDLTEGLLRLAESSETGPLNLGNPVEFDLLTLGNLVAEVLGVQPDFDFKSLPIDDPRQRKPDISKAQANLNWTPKIDVSEGIARTAEWMRKSIARP